MNRLRDFFARSLRRPFSYGDFDCLLYPADWLVEAGYQDPAAAYRGRYRTQLGAQRLISRAGGIHDLVDPGMAAHRRVSAPLLGDVGLVGCLTNKGVRPIGAIFNGCQWVVLGAGGLIAANFPPIAI